MDEKMKAASEAAVCIVDEAVAVYARIVTRTTLREFLHNFFTGLQNAVEVELDTDTAHNFLTTLGNNIGNTYIPISEKDDEGRLDFNPVDVICNLDSR